MVTMKQIDEAREELDRARHEARQHASGSRTAGPYCREQVQQAEATIARLLREWWAQGCREVEGVTVAEYIAAQRDDARLRAEQAEVALAETVRKADKLTKEYLDRAEQAEAALRSVMDRCLDACNGNVSPGSDSVEEVIGLLRMTRRQRDDAEALSRRMEKERDDARAEAAWEKADAAYARESFYRCQKEMDLARVAEKDLEKKLEEAKRDYAVAAAQIEWDRKEIERLKQYALDETNKAIYADRSRLTQAMRDALERLNSPGVAYGQAIEILNAALKFQPQNLPRPLVEMAATRVWVEEKIRGAIEEHAKTRHNGFNPGIYK